MAKNDNTLAILTHLLGLFTGFIGPLIIFLITDSKVVKDHARKALNWQFSLMIYFIVAFILVFLLVGFLLIFALFIVDLIFTIMATVKASNGELWDYPMSIKFFK